MAQIIDGGADVFNAFAYGQPHPNTQQFLASSVENFSNALTEAGSRFFENAREVYERISGSQAARMARAAGRKVRNIWQSDEIRHLREIGEMQHAQPTMQRWIMAEPYVRKLYHQQRLDGYSDSYVDLHPNDRGEDHYDYRRAMNGIVQFNDDGSWTATTYLDGLLAEDRELDIDEQVDIHATWAEVVAAIRAGGSDPTSKFDADL